MIAAACTLPPPAQAREIPGGVPWQAAPPRCLHTLWTGASDVHRYVPGGDGQPLQLRMVAAAQQRLQREALAG